VNRSWFRKRTRSPTFAFAEVFIGFSDPLRVDVDPDRDLALNICTAAIGMRPSPEPRS
jgi:hypothetical protein